MRPKLLASLALAALATSPSLASAAGFGAAVAHVEQRSNPDDSAQARGLFARLGLLGPLQLELDLSRAEFTDSDRRDLRLGAGVHLDVPFFKKWVPFFYAGAGVLQVEAPDWSGEVAFTEYGGGLAYRFARAARLELEFRTGELDLLQSRSKDELLIVRPNWETDEYRSLRLSLGLEF